MNVIHQNPYMRSRSEEGIEVKGFNPFDILDETYKIYPAGVVESGREVSVSKRQVPGKIAHVMYLLNVRIELANREIVSYTQTYSEVQMNSVPDEFIMPMIYRDLEWILRKMEAEVNVVMDRTNKEPWT